MRFKTDENLPAEVAELLNQAGHDALRVDQQGLSGVADPGVAAVCLVEQRAIVTLDTDFADRFPKVIKERIDVRSRRGRRPFGN
jgi:predicted nuclease of predicted toxin-antitoxin system